MKHTNAEDAVLAATMQNELPRLLDAAERQSRINDAALSMGDAKLGAFIRNLLLTETP